MATAVWAVESRIASCSSASAEFALAQRGFQIAGRLVEAGLRRVVGAHELDLTLVGLAGERDLGVGLRELGLARGDDLGLGVVDPVQIGLRGHQRRLGDRERRLELRALEPGDDRARLDRVADIHHVLVDATGDPGADVRAVGVDLALDRQRRRPGREPERRAESDHDRDGGQWSSEPASDHRLSRRLMPTVREGCRAPAILSTRRRAIL